MSNVSITGLSITGGEIKIEYSKSIKPEPDHKLTPKTSSENIKKYMELLTSCIGNDGLDPAFGSSKDDAIKNFVDSVYIWNTFINKNNKLSCETVAIYNSTGPKCERASYQGYNYLGILDSMFDSDNEELNKIELALILGNAWNESGGDIGLFNICLQEDTGGYLPSLCTCTKCIGYDIKLVGRGLLQLSYDANYIPAAYIMNKLGYVLKGKLLDKYSKILDNLPTGELYPPLCGQKNAAGNYIKQCDTADAGDSKKDCCQVPILNTQIQQVCSDIPHKEDTIYTNPGSICNNSGPLSIITSFIYNSANASLAVKNTGYSFLVSACSINQGGYLYPIKTTDYDWIVTDSKAHSYDIMTNAQIEDSVGECVKSLEKPTSRYIGFCTIMNLLFPNNNITSTADWYIRLQNGKYYRSNAATYDSRLYDS
jgi:hypothetical protein